MASSALLTLDVQRKIVKAFGENNEYVERVSRAVRAARGARMPVIHVVARFRAGHPEDSAHNKMLGILRMMGGIGLTPDDEGAAVHPGLDPQPSDLLVKRARLGGFRSTDLELLLRAGGIERIVIAGIATSGAVLSTVREAADLDFEITLLSDGCLDMHEETHRVLTERVFPIQADVVTVDEWITSIA